MAQQRCERVDKMEEINSLSGLMERTNLLIRIIRPMRATTMMRKDGAVKSLIFDPWLEFLSTATTMNAATSRKETRTKKKSKAFQYLAGPRNK
eukprot:CAMPEP_0115732066 /NCGR_PEP_ID=MMETSP0272-20121206/84923_1 /TAXON_ID=71861 /ORGANISM="Scrippsiella trochoidea, Strain CCMP3099" /LENGTH=92 /DNA_ID=CAMNT_0003175951 /DNA_START=12 /DNA_END=287 /DNA_ORIENTATION=-